MSTVYPVKVSQTVFRPEDQANSNPRWVFALSSAHRQDQTFCLCAQQPIPLIIRLYGRENNDRHYGLAVWPHTGLNHDIDCQYFSDDQDTAGDKENKPAFDEMGEGKIRAHLAVSLGIAKANKAAEVNRAPAAQVSKSTRSRATESALLHRLWRHSKLNVCHGKARQWFGTVYSVLKAAQKIVVDRNGGLLADYLLFGTNQQDKMATQHNTAVLARCAKSPTRLFVLGRLRKPDQSKVRYLLPLRDYFGLPKILVQAHQIDSMVRQRPLLRNLLETRDGEVIVLACIEPDRDDWWKLVSITPMSTSPGMIPVDSSYEIEFEKYLVQSNRTFIKPMLNNEIDQDGNRPDFILLDVTPRVRCEVWGMQTEEYLAGKAKRIANYAKRGQRLISWSANPREPFPPLPPATVIKKN